MKRIHFLLPLILATACSSSSSNGGGSNDASSDVTQQNDSSIEDAANDVAANDAATTSDAPSEASSDASSEASTTGDASDGGSNAPDEGAPQVTLTINDYLNWCTVTVNGGSPSTQSPQSYTLAPNTTVTVHGDTASASSFYWGYWGNVASDGGLADGGEDLGKTVTFTITADTTLNACCPDNGQPLSQCTF